MEVKKTFEEPKVEKVEFDFKTRIAASPCQGETLNTATSDCTFYAW